MHFRDNSHGNAFSCRPATTLMKMHFHVNEEPPLNTCRPPTKTWWDKWHMYFHEGYTLTKIGHFH